MVKNATFGEALEHMKTGGYAARVGEQAGWLASQADMLSEDWVLLKGED